MTTKQDVEKWREGCDLAQSEDYERAEVAFLEMSDISARIYFNLASCATKQGKMYYVGKYLDEAMKKDPYMAIGYYQKGCYFLHQKKYSDAKDSFETSLKQLRGNLVIDYKQLGLLYKFYSVEVLLNLAYSLVQMGNKSEALKRLEEAYQLSLTTGEQRHQMVGTAYEAAKGGGSFKPFKLPSSAMFYTPPRAKVDNLQKKNFLGKAKVVASITDNDDFTGFLGAQNINRSPSPTRHGFANTAPSLADKKFGVPKPSGPLPMPPKDRKSPTASQSPALNSGFLKPGYSIPPKPTLKPPSFRSGGTSSPSISPEEEDEIFVKIHYTSTRGLVVDKRITLKDLEESACKKFDRPIGSMTLWYKLNDELSQLTNELSLKKAVSNALDKDRLTLWAYDKDASESGDAEWVEALYDYEALQDGDLPFRAGDRIKIVKELDADWYVGELNEASGIFPKNYVKPL